LGWFLEIFLQFYKVFIITYNYLIQIYSLYILIYVIDTFNGGSYVLPTNSDSKLCDPAYRILAKSAAKLPVIVGASAKPIKALISTQLMENCNLKQYFLHVGEHEFITMLHDTAANTCRFAASPLVHICRMLDGTVPAEERFRVYNSFLRTVIPLVNHATANEKADHNAIFKLMTSVTKTRRRGTFHLDFTRLAKCSIILLHDGELSAEDQTFYDKFMEGCKFLSSVFLL
jgi:hypothetical protein